jgi:hypothetical protein
MSTYHVIAGAFAIHGIAMAYLGLRLPWTNRSAVTDGVGPSWLLGQGRGAVAVGVTVWVVAGGAYLGAAIGFRMATRWWPATAWVGAVLTLIAVALWAGRVPRGVYAGGALAGGTIVYLLLL